MNASEGHTCLPSGLMDGRDGWAWRGPDGTGVACYVY
jgi:hypothetical protein